jgi:glycolate oxidase iron-sulfur subunit
MEPWFPQVHQASIGLLVRAGFRVVVPFEQTCCGALAAHDGAANGARRLADRNEAAFREVDYIVADAAGCSAHLKDYSHWVSSGVQETWNVKDINEMVAEAIEDGRLPQLKRTRGTVALQHPCHLRNAQRITEQPKVILTAAGYEVSDVDPMCCGAAGFYSILRPETSKQLGQKKVHEIRQSGSTTVASANPGCEMQLRSHLEEGYRVLHPVELYEQALVEESGSSR